MAAGFSRLLMRRVRCTRSLSASPGPMLIGFAVRHNDEAKSGYGLSLEDELKILRVIKRLGSEPLRYADLPRRAQHSCGIPFTT